MQGGCNVCEQGSPKLDEEIMSDREFLPYEWPRRLLTLHPKEYETSKFVARAWRQPCFTIMKLSQGRNKKLCEVPLSRMKHY